MGYERLTDECARLVRKLDLKAIADSISEGNWHPGTGHAANRNGRNVHVDSDRAVKFTISGFIEKEIMKIVGVKKLHGMSDLITESQDRAFGIMVGNAESALRAVIDAPERTGCHLSLNWWVENGRTFEETLNGQFPERNRTAGEARDLLRRAGAWLEKAIVEADQYRRQSEHDVMNSADSLFQFIYENDVSNVAFSDELEILARSYLGNRLNEYEARSLPVYCDVCEMVNGM